MVGECHPDVVVMDARMPERDGLEATWEITERWPEVRVVVVSMHTSYRAAALAAGADGFLRKGGTIEELFAAILDARV